MNYPQFQSPEPDNLADTACARGKQGDSLSHQNHHHGQLRIDYARRLQLTGNDLLTANGGFPVDEFNAQSR